MNPAKVDRNRLARLEDLPNIGPAIARDLRLLDVFMSVVSFMAGGPALPWWTFTAERKLRTGSEVR